MLHPPISQDWRSLPTHQGCGNVEHGITTRDSKFRGTTRPKPCQSAEKELIPIILAILAWGATWSDRQIICHCYNQVVVACLKSRNSRCKGVMHLLHCLLLVEACLRCYVHPTYIDTHSNYLADALSHSNLPLFLSKQRRLEVRFFMSCDHPNRGVARNSKVL